MRKKMSTSLYLLFLFLLIKGKKYTKNHRLNGVSEIILSDICVQPVSASDCIEKEGFVGENFRLIQTVWNTVNKEGCKQECLRVNFCKKDHAYNPCMYIVYAQDDSKCVLYTFKYYNIENKASNNGNRLKKYAF